MKCPTYQFQNREDAQFCSKCGTKLEVVCPKCERMNALGSNFCDKCGYPLAEPKAAPPIYYSQPQSYTPSFLADKESILVRCQLFDLSGENDSRSDLKNSSQSLQRRQKWGPTKERS